MLHKTCMLLKTGPIWKTLRFICLKPKMRGNSKWRIETKFWKIRLFAFFIPLRTRTTKNLLERSLYSKAQAWWRYMGGKILKLIENPAKKRSARHPSLIQLAFNHAPPSLFSLLPPCSPSQSPHPHPRPQGSHSWEADPLVIHHAEERGRRGWGGGGGRGRRANNGNYVGATRWEMYTWPEARGTIQGIEPPIFPTPPSSSMASLLSSSLSLSLSRSVAAEPINEIVWDLFTRENERGTKEGAMCWLTAASVPSCFCFGQIVLYIIQTVRNLSLEVLSKTNS